MNITPKFVNPAGSGKKFGSIVGMDDTKLMVKADMVGRFAKGQTYDVKTEDQTWGETTVQVVTAINAAAAPASGNGHGSERWYMPFVSNTVAHAIAAGRIEGPQDIKQWAAAAKQAAEEL